MKTLPPEVLEELRQFSTPTVCNGIEVFGLRGRNEGFMDASVRCVFPELEPMVGYAATATIRAAQPGERRPAPELWAHVQSVPTPRVVVIQDLDDPPGVGAFWGEEERGCPCTPSCWRGSTGSRTNWGSRG